MKRNIRAILASASAVPWAITADAWSRLVAALDAEELPVQVTHPALRETCDVSAELLEPVQVGSADPAARIGVEMIATAGVDVPEPDEPEPDTQALITPAQERAAARKPGSVAIVHVRGTISSRFSLMDLIFGGGVTPPQWVARSVRRAVEDDAVKAVVMVFDSPGGTTTGVPEAFADILALRGRKPIYSQIVGTCGSAAYWIAAAADSIVCTPSGMAGSIGAYMTHQDLSALYEAEGIKITFIQSSAMPNKTEGNSVEPLSDGARAHWQETVDDVTGQFVDAVAKGRGVSKSVVTSERFGQGRVYLADSAAKRGLVDRVRPLSATLAALGVDPESPDRPKRSGSALALAQMDLEARTL